MYSYRRDEAGGKAQRPTAPPAIKSLRWARDGRAMGRSARDPGPYVRPSPDLALSTRRSMADTRNMSYRRQWVGIVAALGATLAALAGITGAAAADSTQYCAQIPIVQGIPPWGFHTGQPITGAGASYARGNGDINLDANTVS